MIQVRVSQIFTPDVEASVAAKKAIDGGTPFPEAVAKYSTCPSKTAGGDLGWMPEENAQGLLGKAITQDDVQKILGPIHSPYGYHLLMITEIQVDRPAGPFTPDSLMVEVNRKLPEVHTLLFKKFHVGLPVAGYKPGETISSIAKSHNQSTEEILALLNKEFAEGQAASITPEELDAKIQSGNTHLVLLDIREQWEHDIAPFEGATLVTRDNCEDLLNRLTPDKEVVLIDWKGDRSPSFQKWLGQRGFHDVKGIEGGIDAWAEKVNTHLARYDIDQEDDDYRYEDILEIPDP
ncbi:MAG: rhodanese-like domain-containing protein [Nitrospinaceae bacterium]